MGILSYLGKQAAGSSKVERFQRLSKGKGNEVKRKLEQDLLQAEKLKKYTGPTPPPDAQKPLLKRTVKIVFPKRAQYDTFKKYFNVSFHIEPSCSNVDLLLLFLEALESGRIIYDRKERSLTTRRR